MDFASSTRAAGKRTRWKEIVVNSSVVRQRSSKLMEKKRKKIVQVKSLLDNSS